MAGGKGRGAGYGALFVGVVTERLGCHGSIQAFAGDECGQWHHAAAQPLSDDDHVGHNTIVLVGEKSPRAAQAGGNFIQN